MPAGRKRLCRAIAASLACAVATPVAGAAPRTLDAYLAQTGPAPTLRVAYGAAPSQYAELFRPAGQGPFPVVVLIHGGCWLSSLGGIVEMRDLAGALAAHGLAVWNVDYRRIDEAGGGYPGTYQDIEDALQALARIAPANHLDNTRIAAVGHSAGGHLVQWIAGRGRIPRASPLWRASFLPVRQIVALGSLGDLRVQAAHIRKVCGVDIAQLTGPASPGRPDPFVDTSAAELLPNGSHTVMINGEVDWQAPPQLAIDYAARGGRAGDRIETVVLPGGSHFDEVSSASPSWPLVLAAILKATQPTNP